MRAFWTTLALSGLIASGVATPKHKDICRELKIPITVSVPRFILNTTVHDDWDLVPVILNFTRRNLASPQDPLPITGMTKPETSTFVLGAELCGTGHNVLITTHGAVESKSYWRPRLSGLKQYDFIDQAVAKGYSVLNYDRIGVGASASPMVDPLNDAQFQVQVAILQKLVDYARDSMKAKKVAFVGHSYGAFISAVAAANATTNVDAVVLMGFNGGFDYFAAFLSGTSLRIANLLNPRRWGTLGTNFFYPIDVYALTYGFFAPPYFDRRVVQWAYDKSNEPLALAELPSIVASINPDVYKTIRAPVFMLQGRFDVSACGGDCIGQLEPTKALFKSAKLVKIVDDLPAGHNLNLHKVAPQAFEMLFDFLKDQGV